MVNHLPVDVDGVDSCSPKLGDLVVLLFHILIVLEAAPAVCDQSPSFPHADKIGHIALQLKHSCLFHVFTDPCLTQVDNVCLEQGGVNLEVFHVWLETSNVEGSHPNFANRVLVPLSRVVVQGSG